MAVMQNARQEVIKALKAAVGKGFSSTAQELEVPRDLSHGDLSYPCFALAKGLKRNPVEVASEIAPKIAHKGMIHRVETKGPYINIYLDTTKLAEQVFAETESEEYGNSDSGHGKKFVVEYYQPNTHKEIHVGHLRTALVGQGVVNVERANGTEVMPVSYIGDLGIHVAKCLWAIQKFHPQEEPAKEDRNAYLGKVYTEAVTWLEEHPEDQEEVKKIFQSLEAGHRGWLGLWKKTKKWSMDVIQDVAAELDLTIDQWYYESEMDERAIRIIDEMLKQKIAEVSEGATIVDLTDEKLGANLLKRTDGTLLYNAKDLALAYKKDEQHAPDLSINVIDVRQTLAQRQLVATLKRFGFNKRMEHLSYEIITLPEGAMSSRKGTIIKYETLRDELIRISTEETQKRHPEWKEKKVVSTARALAFAALKFSILAHDLDKVIVFDFKKALSFDGFTGPYCLYTLARIESIFRKGKSKATAGVGIGKVGGVLAHPSEAALIRKIAELPDVVYRVGQTYQISAVANYAFDLAKQFSEFYHNCPVLQAESPAIMTSRLALCRATSRALKNALALLSIDPVDEM